MGMWKKNLGRIRNGLLLVVSVFLLTGCGAEEFILSAVGSTQKKVENTQEASNEMTVTFLDVGQGDCTIVQAAGHNMVIDAGDNGEGSTVVSYLEENHIDSLDYLILTHPDADHIGGADDVMEAVKVKQVLMPDVSNDTKTYEDVINDIRSIDIDVVHPEVGANYELGDASFEILSPQEVRENDLNASSVGIKLMHGKKSFVMCGDAEIKSEDAVVETFGSGLECDVLKCGHHGSNTATSQEFLDAADPVWAVISCGEGNRYGHPHAEVVSRLEDADVQVYRTDERGTITAVSDGEQISWESEK